MYTRFSTREGRGRRTGRSLFATVVAALAGLTAAPFATAAGPPANDNFADAKVVAGDEGSVAGYTFGATKEPLEPDHAGNPGGRSVWYRWTAPTAGQHGFVTLGSDFDTLLAVYTGERLGALTEVASSEDAGAGVRASMLSFRASAGAVYHVAVDGFGGKVGKLQLTWKPSPPNDHFADAEELAGASGSVTGTTVGATWEPGEPWDGESAAATVWYRWTAPASGDVSFDTVGSRFDTVLGVYVGASVRDVAKVAANDDDPFLGCCSSRVGFGVAAGQTYYIAVDGYESWGRLALSWRPLLRGTARNDALVGTAGAEEIRGLGGADAIRPGAGDDIVFAGTGNDRIAASGGNDRLFGEGGADTVVDLAGRDALHGGGGDDRVRARDGAGRDLVDGGAGSDVCSGDRGDTRIGCP